MPLLNPVHRSGKRNLYCPHYDQCLTHAAKYFWRFWDCSDCFYRNVAESITQINYGSDSMSSAYSLPVEISRKLDLA